MNKPTLLVFLASLSISGNAVAATYNFSCRAGNDPQSFPASVDVDSKPSTTSYKIYGSFNFTDPKNKKSSGGGVSATDLTQAAVSNAGPTRAGVLTARYIYANLILRYSYYPSENKLYAGGVPGEADVECSNNAGSFNCGKQGNYKITKITTPASTSEYLTVNAYHVIRSPFVNGVVDTPQFQANVTFNNGTVGLFGTTLDNRYIACNK
jgi:hypothetical protein